MSCRIRRLWYPVVLFLLLFLMRNSNSYKNFKLQCDRVHTCFMQVSKIPSIFNRINYRIYLKTHKRMYLIDFCAIQYTALPHTRIEWDRAFQPRQVAYTRWRTCLLVSADHSREPMCLFAVVYTHLKVRIKDRKSHMGSRVWSAFSSQHVRHRVYATCRGWKARSH